MISKKKQSGMSIISAIFVMVVLGMLGLYMTSLNSMQHAGSSLSLQSHRAFYSAQSGQEWFVWYTKTNNACPADGTNFTIQNFTVLINSCTATVITEGSKNYKIFDTEITASTTGATLGDIEFASRTLYSRSVGP
jgi:MSHA biogenesis protein MshP